MIYDVAYSNQHLIANKKRGAISVLVRRDKNDPGLEFVVDGTVQRRYEEDVRGVNQFLLLTKYLEWKGEEFQNDLYNMYIEIKKEFEFQADNIISSSEKLPFEIFDKFIRMFDVSEIRYFLKDIYKLKITDVLSDTFEEQMSKDEEGTREQTYLKSDYLDLAAIIVLVKATYITIAHYGYLTKDIWTDKRIEFVLFEFYRRQDLFMFSPAILKIQEFLNKQINKPDVSDEEKWKRNIAQRKSNEEILDDVLVQIVFHRLSIFSIVDDNDDSYTVNLLYKFVKSKFNTPPSAGNNITNKDSISMDSSEGAAREKESYFEAYKFGTDLTVGEVSKANWATGSFEIILPQLSPKQLELMTKPIKINIKGKEEDFTYLDMYKVVTESAIGGYNFSDQSLLIIQTCFKGMMDPRIINRVEAPGMLRLLALTLQYIWNLGLPKLAVLISSRPEGKQDDVVTVNISTGKSRISQELMDKLIEVFPLYKAIGKNVNEGEYVIKRDIEEFADSFYNNIWTPNLPIPLLELTGQNQTSITVPEDLRVQIATFLLANEAITYRFNHHPITHGLNLIKE